jgi:hypothetical protein
MTSTTSFYKITCQRDSFYAQVDRFDDRNYRFFVGANTRCVDISITDAMAHIDMATYDKECSIAGDMVRKEGTVNLILCAMEFVCQIIPSLTPVFTLDGNSMIPCLGGYKTNLKHIFWCVYAKTWYEKYLKATPFAYTAKTTKALQRSYRTHMHDFQQFLSYAQKPPFSKLISGAPHKIQEDLQKDYANMYDVCISLKDFLVRLHSEKDCRLFVGWISDLTGRFLSRYTDIMWQITYDRSLQPFFRIEPLSRPPRKSFIHPIFFGGKQRF